MASPRCGVCGAPMRKNGKTSAGTQRWRCGACGSSAVRKIDSRAKWLGRFAGWLLGKLAQSVRPQEDLRLLEDMADHPHLR